MIRFIIIAVIAVILCKLLFFNKMEYYKNSLYSWNDCNIFENSPPDTSYQIKLAKTFNEYGCIIIPNLISPKYCDEILEHILRNMKDTKNIKYGDINSNYKRKDAIIHIDDALQYIKKIYNKIQLFCQIVLKNCKIVECSSLISFPGSYPQIWHQDTEYDEKDGDLVSFGLALDDLTPDMGPLEVYLKSHKIYDRFDELCEEHGLLDDNYDLNDEITNGIKKQPTEDLCKILNFKKGICSCKKGSLIIWSSKIIHRGGKNKKKMRPIFYFSLLGKGRKPNGSTYSLLGKEYKCSDILHTPRSS